MFRLLLLSLVPGLLVAGAWTLLHFVSNRDNFYLEDMPWWPISVYVVALALTFLQQVFEPGDSLWDALAADYPVASTPDRLPWPSIGLIGTEEHQEIAGAITYATASSVYICRARKYLPNAPWIEIPWTRIEEINLLAPDADAMKMAESQEDRRLLADSLHAKLHLIRQRSQMTLLVPWSERFNRYVPTSIDLVRNWTWPYSVL